MKCKICGNLTIGLLGGYCSIHYRLSPDYPQDLKDDAVTLDLTLLGYPIETHEFTDTPHLGDIVLSDWKEWRGHNPIEKIWDDLARFSNDNSN